MSLLQATSMRSQWSGDTLFDRLTAGGKLRSMQIHARHCQKDSRYFYPIISVAMNKNRPETAMRWMKISKRSGNFGPELIRYWHACLVATGHYTDADKFMEQHADVFQKKERERSRTSQLRFETGFGSFLSRSQIAIDAAHPVVRGPFQYYSEQQAIYWVNLLHELRLKAGSRFGYAFNWFRTSTDVFALSPLQSDLVSFRLNQWQWNLWYSMVIGNCDEVKFHYGGFQNASGQVFFLNPGLTEWRDTARYNSNFYGVSYRKHWRLLDLSLSGYRGYFYGLNQTQYGLSSSLRPFENDRLILGGETGWISQVATNHYWIGHLSLKVTQSFLIQGSAGSGRFLNYVGPSGIYVLNTPETAKKVYSFSIGYNFRPINFTIGWTLQKRESTVYYSNENRTFKADQAVSNYSFIHTSITWYP